MTETTVIPFPGFKPEELPDREGSPLHIGDTVEIDDGREKRVAVVIGFDPRERFEDDTFYRAYHRKPTGELDVGKSGVNVRLVDAESWSAVFRLNVLREWTPGPKIETSARLTNVRKIEEPRADVIRRRLRDLGHFVAEIEQAEILLAGKKRAAAEEQADLRAELGVS